MFVLFGNCYFVNDGEQIDWPVVLYVLHVALLVQQDHHCVLPCFWNLAELKAIFRTPPVMLSSPGALLQPSFFIEASTYVGRITGGHCPLMVYVAAVAPLCLFVAF